MCCRSRDGCSTSWAPSRSGRGRGRSNGSRRRRLRTGQGVGDVQVVHAPGSPSRAGARTLPRAAVAGLRAPRYAIAAPPRGGALLRPSPRPALPAAADSALPSARASRSSSVTRSRSSKTSSTASTSSSDANEYSRSRSLLELARGLRSPEHQDREHRDLLAGETDRLVEQVPVLRGAAAGAARESRPAPSREPLERRSNRRLVVLDDRLAIGGLITGGSSAFSDSG